MSKTPRWVLFARAFWTFGWVILGLNLLLGNTPSADTASGQLFPVWLLSTGVTHWTWRAPHRRLRMWEWPLVILSVLAMFVGGLQFQPEANPQPAFSWFFACYVSLALSYGFFCTAVADGNPMRRQVIGPVQKISRMGIPFFDVGLVLAPFLFPLFLLRSYLTTRRTQGREDQP